MGLVANPENDKGARRVVSLTGRGIGASSNGIMFVGEDDGSACSMSFGVHIVGVTSCPSVLALRRFMNFLCNVTTNGRSVRTIFVSDVLGRTGVALRDLPAFVRGLGGVSRSTGVSFCLDIDTSGTRVTSISALKYAILWTFAA